MSWADGVRATLRGWLRRGREDRELREEMSFHVAREAERNVAAGMTAPEAHRRARLTFGPEDRAHEEVRDARGARIADDLARDVGYALRTLRRTPAFTAVALLTIGKTSFAVLSQSSRAALLLRRPALSRSRMALA